MKTPITTKLSRILTAPIAEWAARIQAISEDEAPEIASELRALIQRAALLDAYLSNRRNCIGGDQGHDKSAKRANAQIVKVRAAMGFAYPKNVQISIS